MYIRLVTSVGDSVDGRLALALLPALVRIAPVRLMDPRGPVMAAMSGTELDLGPEWAPYESMFTTPMQGAFVNVVCCDPVHWAWSRTIDAPTEDLSARQLAEGAEVKTEKIAGDFELYTEGVRNVLVPPWSPTSARQAESAFKYQSYVLCTSIAISSPFMFKQSMRGWTPGVVPDREHIFDLPITKHREFRKAVMG